jgi:hypothetical protein
LHAVAGTDINLQGQSLAIGHVLGQIACRKATLSCPVLLHKKKNTCIGNDESLAESELARMCPIADDLLYKTAFERFCVLFLLRNYQSLH